jgi:hypothetical protein
MWLANLIFVLCLMIVTAAIVVSWRVLDAAEIHGKNRWILLTMSGVFLPLAGMLVAVGFHSADAG